MKNKKGFTLIELLAIIVILAIIAVITVPIILNIIDNSKKGAVVDSAYGYKDAVQKYYLSELVNDPNQEAPTGTYNISDLPSTFSVSGEVPSDGWIKLEKGQVVDYSLKFGDYVVSFDLNTGKTVAEKSDDLKQAPRIVQVGDEVCYGPTESQECFKVISTNASTTLLFAKLFINAFVVKFFGILVFFRYVVESLDKAFMPVERDTQLIVVSRRRDVLEQLGIQILELIDIGIFVR